MVHPTLNGIKVRTKMKVDNFILLLFCYLFGDYSRRVISIVIVKEIVFTFVVYVATVYHQSERVIIVLA